MRPDVIEQATQVAFLMYHFRIPKSQEMKFVDVYHMYPWFLVLGVLVS